MAMKKTSGGDSPLRQGAGKSFWTLPISGQRRWWIAMCFWKIDRVFRFFPLGVFIGEGAAPEVGQGASPLVGTARGWAAPPCGVGALWPLSVSSSDFWKLR
jgi:hypothetical protein